jgi:hypothetical protein
MTSGFAEAAVWRPQAELINTLNIQTHTLFSPHNDENKDQIAKKYRISISGLGYTVYI